MRHIRTAALGAAMLALVAGACSPGEGGTPGTAETQGPGTSPASEQTLASTFVLAAPPECPERPFCAKGLREVYGIEFKEIKPTDAGGPITVEALKRGDAQVGLLFTSDPAIEVNNFVLLEDDRQLQLADNLIPVVRQEVLDASPEIADLLNAIMARLDQDALTSLNTQVTIEARNPGDVATEWLTGQGLLPGAGGSGKASVTVGSTNFYEQEIIAELFAQTLEGNGFSVERKFQLGNREIVFPALESGQIDILAEYAATALEHVNEGAGEASTDPVATAARLRDRLEPRVLTALDHAEATDQNGFVVTQEMAARYSLSRISDLAKPAP